MECTYKSTEISDESFLLSVWEIYEKQKLALIQV